VSYYTDLRHNMQVSPTLSLSKTPSSPLQVQLPNLKILVRDERIRPESPIIQLISAPGSLVHHEVPNLVTLESLPRLRQIEGMNVVRHFNFNFTPENLPEYEKFADSRPKLVSLRVETVPVRRHPEIWPRVTSILARILESSKGTKMNRSQLTKYSWEVKNSRIFILITNYRSESISTSLYILFA